MVTKYRIVVEGELGDRFFATFGEIQVDRVAGETWLTGDIADQTRLQGLIAHIADLGLSLRSVGPASSDPPVAFDPVDLDTNGTNPVAGGTR